MFFIFEHHDSSRRQHHLTQCKVSHHFDLTNERWEKTCLNTIIILILCETQKLHITPVMRVMNDFYIFQNEGKTLILCVAKPFLRKRIVQTVTLEETRQLCTFLKRFKSDEGQRGTSQLTAKLVHDKNLQGQAFSPYSCRAEDLFVLQGEWSEPCPFDA